jgi:hypothetical protein
MVPGTKAVCVRETPIPKTNTVAYGRRLEARLDLLRLTELDFLIGLRAGFLATAFLAAALRDDFFAGFLAAAALTDRFGLPRGLAAAFLGFLTTFAALVAKEATALPAAWAASCVLSIPDLATSSPVCAEWTTVLCTVERMPSCSLSS